MLCLAHQESVRYAPSLNTAVYSTVDLNRHLVTIPKLFFQLTITFGTSVDSQGIEFFSLQFSAATISLSDWAINIFYLLVECIVLLNMCMVYMDNNMELSVPIKQNNLVSYLLTTGSLARKI
jgi:hypothetical protein